MKKFSKFIGKDWYDLNKDYINSDQFKKNVQKIGLDRKRYTVYPKVGSTSFMKAFRELPPHKVKIVILGQDPYHSGSFDGLAFSNKYSKFISPSLKNIFKELEKEYGIKRTNKNLQDWANQGVLLINVAHTVIKSRPGSHLYLWHDFTTNLIQNFSDKYSNVVWLLWGKRSQEFEKYISLTNTTIQCSHPSPFSADKTNTPFLGSNCFTLANQLLIEFNRETISWV